MKSSRQLLSKQLLSKVHCLLKPECLNNHRRCMCGTTAMSQQAFFPDSGLRQIVLNQRHLLCPIVYERHTTKPFHKESIQTNDKHICITEGNKEYKFPYFWLRDHCRCPDCFHPETSQMLHEITDLDFDIQPKTLDVDEDCLHLTWKDDHESLFPFSWLKRNKPGIHQELPQIPKRTLWQGSMFSPLLASYSLSDLYSSKEALRDALVSLYQYGMVAISDVQSNVEECKTIAKLFGRARTTFYGGGKDVYTFESDMSNADTGYTDVALNLHTDGNYFNETPGALLFSCQSHDGSGGESTFTDGIHAAETLRQQHPLLFKVLWKTPVLYQFVDQERVFRSFWPSIKLNEYSNEVEQIRFNPYDRAPVANIPFEDIQTFYQAYQELTKLLFAPENEFRIKLNPGTAMIVDNWRVLHGRTAFTGRRVMCFAYLARDDLLSQYRVVAGIPLSGV